MPNIIEWADWQAAQANINAANKAVSGMTPAEAQAALKFGQTGLQNGSNLQIVNSQNIPSSGQVIQFPNVNASQAAGDYIASGGQITTGGAAATSGNVAQVSNMAMTQKAGGLASVAALLSVNLPTAAAAIAPVAGVALGAGLYSLNPELWDKISRALLPFCYEGTELLPVVADENGVTYFPKDAVDAASAILRDNFGIESSSTDSDLAERLSPYPYPIYRGTKAYIKQKYGDKKYYVGEVSEEVNIVVVRGLDGGQYIQFASDKPFSKRSATLKDPNDDFPAYEEWDPINRNTGTAEEPVYAWSFSFAISDNLETNPPVCVRTIKQIDSTELANQFLKSMIYGTSSSAPEGTSTWTGVQYPLNPEGIGVVTRIGEDGVVTTNPYYPITMPVGDPGVSPNPSEVPVPGVNPEIAPAVDPWLTPVPNPNTYPEGQPESDPAKVPDPVPGTSPNLDPNANPSQAPQPQPDPSPDQVQSTRPNDAGTSALPAIPIIPTLPSAATGLLHVYNPTQSQIDAFGSWLWTTFSGDLIDTISKLFNDPMDAVIGLHELYATPAVSGSSTIRAGFLDSGVPSNLVGSRYTTINCGSIVVQEYYQNYLDYSPYTKCYIYLPFVGIVPVLADDIIGNAVNVTYHVDSYTGCCIAVVTVAREGYSSTVYQFEGNCAVEIPITSGYQSTLMGALIGIGGAALTGNPHAGIAAANMGRASLGKNDVSHSGSFGSSYGAMGAKVPYIIVKRPTQKSVVNYNQDYGFPAHKRVTIGACSGFLRAREVHVISPTATDDEKARIEELLKDGVFVK